MIVIAGNNGTKRKRSVKAHVRILPILHLGFNALRQFSQRLSEGGERALRSESSLAKSKPFLGKRVRTFKLHEVNMRQASSECYLSQRSGLSSCI